MLDSAIGPIIRFIDYRTFQINVTHIGRHNQFRYNTYETIFVVNNFTGYTIREIVGCRVRCHIKYRDTYGRLVADVHLE